MTIDLTNWLHLWAIVYGLGLAGMASHYVKKWLRKEIEGSLLDYLFRDHARDTAFAIFTYAGVAASALLAGQFDGMTLKQIALPAWLLGYTIDSAVNKATTKPTP